MSNEVLIFGGIFNYVDPFFGVQLYLWGFLIMLIFTGIAWLVWRYGVWEPYKPVWGLYYAFKAVSWAAFIFNAGLVSELVSEREAKCIFDYSRWKYKGLNRIQALLFNYATVFLPDLSPSQAILYKLGGRNMDVEIAKKLQDGEWENHSSVTSGGIHCDMILDADRWSVRDSPQHRAIETFCETHNDANPEDQIHSYCKFARLYSVEKSLPDIPGVKREIIVQWSRIDSAFPVEVGDNEDAGAVRQVAREMEESDNQGYGQFYIPIIIAEVGIIIIIAALRLIGLIF